MIPVIIINRDLMTWPRAMVDKIKTYKGVGEIIIVDNSSTYPPLLEWYKTNPCRIVRVANLGHKSPWMSGVVASLKSSCYVVTDPDLVLDDTPDDTLLYLQEKIGKIAIGKIGLDMDWKKVPSNSPYFNHVQTYERYRRVNSKVVDEIMVQVLVDTTFALYNQPRYFVGGGSAKAPYIARHLPWEFTREQYESNAEFKYYIQNASSSSSYKGFLNLK